MLMSNEASGQSSTDGSGDQSPSTSSLATPSPVPQKDVIGQVCNCNSPENGGAHNLSQEVHWLEHATFWSQVCLGLIGVAALIIYFGQLSEMKKATNITQQAVINADRNFRRDERAWIGFSLGGGNLTLTVGQPFSVPTTLINSGKTPAKNVEGNIIVTIVKRGAPFDFVYASGHANYRIAAGSLFPNATINESFQAIRHGPVHAEAIIVTKPILDEITASQSLVVVYGRLTYSDIFGIEHWTTYCRIVSNPSLIPDDCVRYNNTDDGG